jgi:hypothetical protein
MAFKVKLSTMEDDWSEAERFGLITVGEGLTYTQFRRFFEDDNIVEWSFQFRDSEEKCRMMTKLERFNLIGGAVTVIALASSLEVSNKRPRVEVGGSTRDSTGVVPLFCSQEEVSVSETPLGESRLSSAITFDGRLIPNRLCWRRRFCNCMLMMLKTCRRSSIPLLLMTMIGVYRLKI